MQDVNIIESIIYDIPFIERTDGFKLDGVFVIGDVRVNFEGLSEPLDFS